MNNFNYKDVISRILICPKDGRSLSAKTFWKKETVLFKKIYGLYPSESFWQTLSLENAQCKNGRIPSLALFFDKKNYYWKYFLKKQWKRFHWQPKPHKPLKFKRDITEASNYTVKSKKTFRNFFSDRKNHHDNN